MIINRKSLVYQLIVPVFFTVVVILAVLIFSINQITNRLIEEFVGNALSSHVSETMRIIEMAQTDLTTARLLDNPPVVEAKKRLVLEAISLKWQRSGVIGMIAGKDGSIFFSSLPSGLTQDMSTSHLSKSGMVRIEDEKGELHGKVIDYPAWSWRVFIAMRSLSPGEVRKEVYYLIPLVVLGSALIISTLFFLLRRNLQRPVSTMVEDVRQGRTVRYVGVNEFDLLGTTINNAVTKIAQRNQELAHELEERKKAELAVREKETQIRLLLESAAEGIYGLNTEGVCTFCNSSCLRMLGYKTEKALLGSMIHGRIHHSHADGSPYLENECRIYQAYRNRQNIHIDNEVFWRADGSSFPVECWSYPVLQQGECIGAIVTFFDITERKQAETKLKEEKNKFESIIAAMGDGISIQDLEYNVLYQNDVHKGFTGDHVGEKCFRGFGNKDDVCPGCPVEETFHDGKVHRGQRIVERTGGAQYFDITTSPLRDATGRISACIELVRDVTDRRRADEHLYQAQRMESVGLLAGGVAHDFNNLMSAIFGYAEMLQMDMDADDTMKSYVNQILAAAERATGLTKSLLAFSSKQAATLKPLNISDTVCSFYSMLARLVGEHIEFKLNLSEQLLMVQADKGQVEQVLMNLVTNARDAMPGGGRLQLQTELIKLDEDWGDLTKGSYAVIAVSDSGEGMSSDTLQHIFEPFFTTKEVGKGTGLGLAIVYGIVKKHDGSIHVYSESGKGTTFKIYIPLLTSWGNYIEQEKLALPPSGTETILLVEDEPSVREVTATMLKRFGYSIVEAVDGEDAVKVFRENQNRINLVLCDLIMPHKDGKEACDEIKKMRPYIKWIFMSGYTADIISQKMMIGEGIPFISKPLVPTALMSKIREVLDEAEDIRVNEVHKEGGP